VQLFVCLLCTDVPQYECCYLVVFQTVHDFFIALIYHKETYFYRTRMEAVNNTQPARLRDEVQNTEGMHWE